MKMSSFRVLFLVVLCLSFVSAPIHLTYSSPDISYGNYGDNYYIFNDQYRIDFWKGKFNISKADGTVIIKNAISSWYTNISETWAFHDVYNRGGNLNVSFSNISDTFGDGVRMNCNFTSQPNRPNVTATFDVYDGEDYFNYYLQITNVNASTMFFSSFEIIYTTYSGLNGGVLVGDSIDNMLLYPYFYSEIMYKDFTLDGAVSWEPEILGPIACMFTSTSSNDSLLLGLTETDNLVPRLVMERSGADKHGFSVFNYILRPTPDYTANASFIEIASGNSYTTSKLFVEVSESNEPPTVFSNISEFTYEHNDQEASNSVLNSTSIGYSTWIAFGTNINQSKMLSNLDYFATNFSNAGLFQIDDGWQNDYGDWLVNTTKFPDGMTHLAGNITDYGLTAGLWIAPWLMSNTSNLYATNPTWRLQNKDGGYYNFSLYAKTMFYLDPTNSLVQTFIEDLFTNFTSWGYNYFKIDFTPFVKLSGTGFLYSNASQPWIEGMHKCFEAIRNAAPTSHISANLYVWPYLNNTFQSFRYAVDIGNTILGIERIARRTAFYSLWANVGYPYLDVDSFHANDADYGRYPMTSSTMRLWNSFAYVSGSVQIVGGDFDVLSEERINVLKGITAYPSTGKRVTVLDADNYNNPPRTWLIDSDPTGGKGKFLCVFNWDFARINYDISLEDLGLPKGVYFFRDYWTGTVYTVSDSLEVAVGARSSVAFIIYSPIWASDMIEVDYSYVDDFSFTDNDGIMSNVVLTPLLYTWGGNDARFNGINSYIAIPHKTIYNTGAITISLWFKVHSISDSIYYNLIEKQYASAWEIQVWNQRLSVNAKIGGTYYAQYLSNVTAIAEVDHWYHVVFTYDGVTTGNLYLDGVLMDTRTNVSGGLGNSTAPIYLGIRGAGFALPLDGSITKVRIYNYALPIALLKDVWVVGYPDSSWLIMPLMGIGGFVLCGIGVFYVGQKIRERDTFGTIKATLYAMMIVLIGAGLIIGWLW